MTIVLPTIAEAGYSCTSAKRSGSYTKTIMLGQLRPRHALHGVHVRPHAPDELQLRHHRQARRPDNPAPRQDKLAALIRAAAADGSIALAIPHKSNDRIIIDVIREASPPFSPDAVVQDFAALLNLWY